MAQSDSRLWLNNSVCCNYQRLRNRENEAHAQATGRVKGALSSPIISRDGAARKAYGFLPPPTSTIFLLLFCFTSPDFWRSTGEQNFHLCSSTWHTSGHLPGRLKSLRSVLPLVALLVTAIELWRTIHSYFIGVGVAIPRHRRSIPPRATSAINFPTCRWPLLVATMTRCFVASQRLRREATVDTTRWRP